MIQLSEMLTGDTTSVAKLIIIGVVCILLVVGVTIMGVFSSKKVEEEIEEIEENNSDSQE